VKCPYCGHVGGFRVNAYVEITVSGDDGDAYCEIGKPAWDDDMDAICEHCGEVTTVGAAILEGMAGS
jgi:hypothetical protein